MSEPSYVIGNSYSLRNLTDVERRHLDQAPWVFVCNSFLSHWQDAGFRPTVWCFGDNHHYSLIAELEHELFALAEDPLLQERLQYSFVGLENFATKAKQMVEQYGLLPLYYFRGQVWFQHQQPAQQLGERIYHHGSTLTDLVNFARILNPDGEIRLYGNEWGPGFGHFWEGKITHRYPAIWPRVKRAMWRGLASLHRTHDYPLVDCNRHEEPLPAEFTLPTGQLCGFPHSNQ